MIIVKIGGGKSVFDNLDNILADFASLNEKKILIHGANHLASGLFFKLGIKEEILKTQSGFESRRTTREVLEVLEMAYGLANRRIVERLQKLGVNAVGLSGMDGRIWEGERKDAVKAVVDGKLMMVRDDYTGKAVNVNTGLLMMLIENGYVPVLTIPGISFNNEAINLDNDRALAVTAGKMGCKRIVLLFEAHGLLADPSNEKTLIKTLSREELGKAIENTHGRMKKKMLGVKEALDLGVEEVFFGDLRWERPITRSINAEGTRIG
ncbi:MAG: [LysW]-aminoadipate kinase [Nanoarchaeota archaeon]|nr:[LysW]-aminoadipate kinase [Nanoarchaeota archaeon]